jgi:NSS family neurotransmitter:Na+ symporter
MLQSRQNWGSQLGLILAVAGSAVGLGNFLRFPAQAAQNGGGSFMIPYLIALLLVGLPLLWVEFTLGRYGGHLGHGTAPGVFHNMSNKNRFYKYFGVIGIFGPMVIFFYYLYIESWLLGYLFQTLTMEYRTAVEQKTMQDFFGSYVSLDSGSFLGSLGSWLPAAYLFFILTFALNFWVLAGGVRRGIEKLALWGLPLLLILAIGLTIRVLTMGAPDPAHPEWTVWNGMGFLWNPDLSRLTEAKVWLAATGQILFTLSVGMGCVLTYASYMKRKQDVVVAGASSASTNTFAEVILGGSLVIPVAFAFLGPQEILAVAQSGTFNLGFVTMPLMLGQMPMATLLAFVWFLLLFLAGLTSSVSMLQTGMAFLEDEFGWSRQKTLWVMGAFSFVACQPAIFGLSHGVVDEMDFWAGTFGLVVFALVEVILFAWVFGMDKAWEELHLGAKFHLPLIFKFVIKWVTPPFLIVILVVWAWQQGIDVLLMKNAKAEDMPWVLGTRVFLVLFFVVLALMARHALKTKAKQKEILS